MKSLKLALSVLALLGVTATANAQERVYQDPQRCLTDVGSLSPDAAFLGNYTTIRTNMDVNGDGFIAPEEQVVACDDSFVQAFTDDNDTDEDPS